MNRAIHLVHEKIDVFSGFLQRVKFRELFLYWVGMAVMFGLAYYLLSFTPGHGLQQDKMLLTPSFSSFISAQYFSFITSETVGYGDIVPQGFSRFLASLEGFVGFLIFGVVISKLVSVKQEHLLQEVYKLGIDEKTNRVRSALFLFRKDAQQFMDRLYRGVGTAELKDLWVLLQSLDEKLTEAVTLTCQDQAHEHSSDVMRIDSLHVELIALSMTSSMAKLSDLIAKLEQLKSTWTHPRILQRIHSITTTTAHFVKVHEQKYLSPKLQNRLQALSTLSKELAHHAQQTPKLHPTAEI